MKSILIVEDTEINVDLLTQILEDDYNLLVAVDGAQGVSMTEQHHPDLILMDIALPVMDGYEATRRIKSNPALKDIPIIGVSAHAMSGDAERAQAAGCDDYMTKPLNNELLLEKLKKFLG
jgi:CheY-like chemotaxis protein